MSGLFAYLAARGDVGVVRNPVPRGRRCGPGGTVSGRFFAALGDYLDAERPRSASTDRVFVVLKGPHRGSPLSAAGLDEILAGAWGRAGLARLTLWVPETRLMAVDLPLRRRQEPGMIRRWRCG